MTSGIDGTAAVCNYESEGMWLAYVKPDLAQAIDNVIAKLPFPYVLDIDSSAIRAWFSGDDYVAHVKRKSSGHWRVLLASGIHFEAKGDGVSETTLRNWLKRIGI